MKDKNLPIDYISFSLEELTRKANKIIEELESQKDLAHSVYSYQKLLKLNSAIQQKFQKDIKSINEKTKNEILKITLKKNAK